MKAPITKIQVALNFSKTALIVGELRSIDRKIYFKYDVDFLKTGIEISPFKLKTTEAIIAADAAPFEGLHGIFADSLPDGWGRLLLDRSLQNKGIDTDALGPLDRLAFVGTTGMGALTYQPNFDAKKEKEHFIELDKLAKASEQILQGSVSDFLEELQTLGGSSAGARPKVLVGYSPKKEKLIANDTKLKGDYEAWLIKFNAFADRIDSANIEYAYYQMALKAGLLMNPSKLFTSKSNRVFFGTRRFDRQKNKRLHMASAAALLNDNFRLSTLDYGHLMDAAYRLEKSALAHEKILRLATFNVFSNNRDDHSKNVSFLMNEFGEWQLAPAYDLTYSNSSHGFHSTSIAGESAAPGRKHLIELAAHFSIKKAKHIIDEVAEAVTDWRSIAKTCGVEKKSVQVIEKAIAKNLK